MKALALSKAAVVQVKQLASSAVYALAVVSWDLCTP